MSLLIPLPPGSYRISSPFGERVSPISGKRSQHNGLDMAASTGTPILAAADGVVTKTYANHDVNGNGAILTHSGIPGIDRTAYIHMDRLLVSDGQRVRRGQQIGTVGTTGRSTGPHLHFIVYRGWTPVDPAPLLRNASAAGLNVRGLIWLLGGVAAAVVLRRLVRRRRVRRITLRG